MFEHFFIFPIAMIDRDIEERKAQERHDEGLKQVGPTIIRGHVEIPHTDSITGISDRWLPTNRSHQKAMDGIFDACYVTFRNMGSYLVPMNRTEFKLKYQEYYNSLPEEIRMQGKGETMWIDVATLKEIAAAAEEEVKDDKEVSDGN